jgi:hypothetical protein
MSYLPKAKRVPVIALNPLLSSRRTNDLRDERGGLSMPINVNKAVDKSYETKSLKEISNAPVSALEGLTDAHGKLLEELGIKTIKDLGEWKFANWARAIVELAKLEE